MKRFRIITAAILAVGVALALTDKPVSEETVASVPERVEIAVGDVLPASDVHIITSPGRYGLGPEIPGSQYAVSHGRLIRIEPSSRKVLSILRVQNGVLD